MRNFCCNNNNNVCAHDFPLFFSFYDSSIDPFCGISDAKH